MKLIIIWLFCFVWAILHGAFVVGIGLGFGILFFPITYFIMNKKKKFDYSRGKCIGLFFLAVWIIGPMSSFLSNISSTPSYLHVLAAFVVPPAVSVLVLLFANKIAPNDNKAEASAIPREIV